MAAATAKPTTVARPACKREQVLPACPDQVRVARAFAACFFAGCPAADDAVLCVSDLKKKRIRLTNGRSVFPQAAAGRRHLCGAAVQFRHGCGE
jgi:hypothetical protein